MRIHETERIAQLEQALAAVNDQIAQLEVALAERDAALEGLMRRVHIAVSIGHALDLIRERKAIASQDCKRSYFSGFAPMQ